MNHPDKYKVHATCPTDKSSKSLMSCPGCAWTEWEFRYSFNIQPCFCMMVSMNHIVHTTGHKSHRLCQSSRISGHFSQILYSPSVSNFAHCISWVAGGILLIFRWSSWISRPLKPKGSSAIYAYILGHINEYYTLVSFGVSATKIFTQQDTHTHWVHRVILISCPWPLKVQNWECYIHHQHLCIYMIWYYSPHPKFARARRREKSTCAVYEAGKYEIYLPPSK